MKGERKEIVSSSSEWIVKNLGTYGFGGTEDIDCWEALKDSSESVAEVCTWRFFDLEAMRVCL